MNIFGVVDKKIGAFDARRKFGQILREVEIKGDRFVVERHGEAVAAVVPIGIYNQWKKSRKDFFAKIRAAADTANLSEKEAEKVITKAVKATRQASN